MENDIERLCFEYINNVRIKLTIYYRGSSENAVETFGDYNSCKDQVKSNKDYRNPEIKVEFIKFAGQEISELSAIINGIDIPRGKGK